MARNVINATGNSAWNTGEVPEKDTFENQTELKR